MLDETTCFIAGGKAIEPPPGLNLRNFRDPAVHRFTGRDRTGRPVTEGDLRRPGIWAHTYFHHADGAWLVLYAWLRLEAGFAPPETFDEAVRRATGARRHVDLGDLAPPPVA